MREFCARVEVVGVGYSVVCVCHAKPHAHPHPSRLSGITVVLRKVSQFLVAATVRNTVEGQIGRETHSNKVPPDKLSRGATGWGQSKLRSNSNMLNTLTAQCRNARMGMDGVKCHVGLFALLAV
jgi:hypothetical protein